MAQTQEEISRVAKRLQDAKLQDDILASGFTDGLVNTSTPSTTRKKLAEANQFDSSLDKNVNNMTSCH
jgi:hypothetical protein